MIPERRKQERTPTALKVRIDGPRGRQHLTGRDLSESGIFLEATKPLPLGQFLECRLELPIEADRPTRVEVHGEVRHQSNAYQTQDGQGPFRGFGVRFTRIGADEQATLRRFLEARRASG